MAINEEIAKYLRKPYTRSVTPEDDNTYRGEILEFSGCIATGNTAAEALSSLEEVAASWLESELSRGHVIPPPFENSEYSGRILLRLSKSLHRKAALMANRDGVSLNQYIVTSLSEHIGERSSSSMSERGKSWATLPHSSRKLYDITIADRLSAWTPLHAIDTILNRHSTEIQMNPNVGKLSNFSTTELLTTELKHR